MKIIKFIVLRLIVLCCPIFLQAQEIYQSTKLEKVWETAEGLNVPESAFYHKADKTIYVSNICGIPNEKDGVGYISKLNIKGEFIEKEWVKGLNAPKGINIYKGKLYVTDIDEVLEIDLKTGSILKRYKNINATAINDVAIDKKGKVFITDTKTNCIFFIGKDSLEVFIQSDDISRVNGAWVYKNQLLFGSKNNLVSLNLLTKKIQNITENTGYIDGIVSIGKNRIIISDWKGKIQYIHVGKEIENLLNTTSLGIYAADLGYVPRKKTLLVPTFLDNKIVAYKFEN